MKFFLLSIILLSLGLGSSQAQPRPIAHVETCISHDITGVWVWPNETFYASELFGRLTGEPVLWLGHSSNKQAEMQGIYAGYSGVDLRLTEQVYIIYLFEDGQIVERWVAREIQRHFFLMRTNTKPYTSDGLNYEYLGWRSDCLFLIDGQAMRWLTHD